MPRGGLLLIRKRPKSQSVISKLMFIYIYIYIYIFPTKIVNKHGRVDDFDFQLNNVGLYSILV
jgi:hypothetical protein